MESYDRLLAYNIKHSVQRIAIMEYLMNHYTHPTVDDIYTDLFLPFLRFPRLRSTIR